MLKGLFVNLSLVACFHYSALKILSNTSENPLLTPFPLSYLTCFFLSLQGQAESSYAPSPCGHTHPRGLQYFRLTYTSPTQKKKRGENDFNILCWIMQMHKNLYRSHQLWSLIGPIQFP